MFGIIDHFRARGLRVGLVTVDHGGILNGEIRARVDGAWFFKTGDAAARSVFDQLPGPLRRSAQRARNIARKRLGRLRASFKRPTAASSSKDDGAALSYLALKIWPAFDAFAARCAAQSCARVAVAEFAWATGAFAGLGREVLRVVDTHDVQHLRRQNAQAAGHDLPDRACGREEEIAALATADVLLAIQRGEAEILREMLPGARVITAEHALARLIRCPVEETRLEVLFVGNYYPPNIAGVEQFLAQVWPQVRAAAPAARFVVCGKVCDAFRGCSVPGVELAGVVPDLEPYYRAAAIVVNTVPYGTGLKIKTVEALAHGKCTVVTPAGAEGLATFPDEGLRVCAIEEMGGVIAALLGERAALSRASDGAWRFAEKHLSGDAVYGEITALVEAHLRGDVAYSAGSGSSGPLPVSVVRSK